MKYLWSLCFWLFLSIILIGCQTNDNYTTATNAENISHIYVPLADDDEIILPPNFLHSGEKSYWNYFFTNNDFLSACRFSKCIVRAKIGNYIREEEYGNDMGVSIFEIQIIECYKGNLEGVISVAWESYSGGAHSDVELPFYGDEMVLFLDKEEHNDYFGIYCISFEFDIVPIEETLYVVSENMNINYQLGFLIPEYIMPEYPSLATSVSEFFNNKINYWEQKVNSTYKEFSEERIKNIFVLEDFIILIKYIANNC